MYDWYDCDVELLEMEVDRLQNTVIKVNVECSSIIEETCIWKWFTFVQGRLYLDHLMIKW